MSSKQNWGKWSDIDVVILPPFEYVSISFMKILSMSVADVAETLVG